MSWPHRYSDVHFDGELMPAAPAQTESLDFDKTFTVYYARIVRVVSRVTADRGRAEEVAVDAFVKWWRHPAARRNGSVGWLYRTAVRLAIDDARRLSRHAKYERLMVRLTGRPRTPVEEHESNEMRRRTRTVLQTMRRRDATLLILRSDGLAYGEVAAALKVKASSIGTLLSRAQRAFRLEYVRRYGEP